MGSGVGMDEFDGVFEAGEAEGLAGEGNLGGQNFEGAETAVFLLAGEGEPHGGVAGGSADFDVEAGGRGGGEEGDELAGFTGDLAQAFELWKILLAVLIEFFEEGHAIADSGSEVVEHANLLGGGL